MMLIKDSLISFGLESEDAGHALRSRLESKNIHYSDQILSGNITFSEGKEIDCAEIEQLLSDMRELIPKIKKEITTWPKVFEWEALINKGLAYPPSNCEMIQAIENKIDRTLPPSYKSFLMQSNGWLTDQEIFLPVEEIGWLKDKDPELIIDWCGKLDVEPPDPGYFKYDLNNNILPNHVRFLPQCILISEHYGVSSRFYLLNSGVVFEDGEWEAWSLEPRTSGAVRFRSFQAMMEWLYVDSIHALREAAYERPW